MEYYKEVSLSDYPNSISYECTKKIMEQMEKNICKIKIGNIKGTGFFCKIPFPSKEKMLPVFITNNHVISKDLLYKKDAKISIDIKEDTNLKQLILDNRIKYTNEKYDITIIEIKESDKIKNYLELDEIMINDIVENNDKNKEYIDKTIYIIHYPENELSVSYGILNKIYEDKLYDFQHKCSTKFGSSGSPILTLNNKIIGIHKEGNNRYNKGLFLNYPIQEFIKLNNDNIKKINKKDIKKNINNDNNIYEKNSKNINDKYNINTINNDIDFLNLYNYSLGNIGLKDLSKINFTNLNKVDLCSNNISDINSLKKFNFEKLKELKLSNNSISDINIFEKLDFKELEELDLKHNNISDIEVLKNCKLEKLKILDLGENKISDIKVLENVNFEKIEFLNLDFNYIKDISILGKTNFKELNTLSLKGNCISDIKVLSKVKFKKLELLDLSLNEISDINILEKVNFKELKELYLNNNLISDIKVFVKVNFEKLELLELSKNKIDEKSDYLIINYCKENIKNVIFNKTNENHSESLENNLNQYIMDSIKNNPYSYNYANNEYFNNYY